MSEKMSAGMPAPEERMQAATETIARFRELAEKVARSGARSGPGSFSYQGELPDSRRINIGVSLESNESVHIVLYESMKSGYEKQIIYRLEEDGKLTKNVRVIDVGAIFGEVINLASQADEKFPDDDDEAAEELHRLLAPRDVKAAHGRAAEDEAKNEGITILTEAEVRELNGLLERITNQ